MAGITPENGQRLLESGEFSDFLVVCDGKEWKVHNMVVCVESTYFRTVAKGNFDGGGKDRCELKQEDPANIQCVLEWLYTGNYGTPGPKAASTSELKLDGKMVDGESANDTTQHAQGEAATTAGPEQTTKQETDPAEQVLYAHISLYACADRLGIEPLSAAISKDFLRLARCAFKESYFPGVIEAVCGNTAQADKHLRHDFFHEYLQRSDSREDVMAILEVREPLPVALANTLVSARKSLEAKIAKITEESQSAESKADSYGAAADAMMKWMSSFKSPLCQTCKAAMYHTNSRMDYTYINTAQVTSLTRYYVKCGTCGSVQYFN